MGPGGFMDVKTLPTAGNYTIVVDNYVATTGSITLTLYNVPADFTGTITPGGASVTVTTTTPGQNGQLTFAGTAGQRISLQGTTGTYGNNAGVSILKPDNSVLAPLTWMGPGGFIDVKTLPTTGTYTIVVDNYTTTTGSITLTLYNVPADSSASLIVGGSSVSLTTTTPGQN